MTTLSKRAAGAGLLLAALMLLSVLPATPGVVASWGAPLPSTTSPGAVGSVAPTEPLSELLASPLAPVPGAVTLGPMPNSSGAPSPPDAGVPVLLTLGFENDSRLSSFLAALQEPASAQYHRYLSASAFASEFAPNASTYATVVEYLASYGVASLTRYPDRLAVSFTASPGTLGQLFHTDVERLSEGGVGYWAATTTPTLPAPLAAEVASVSGLGASSLPVALPLAGTGPIVRPASGTGARPSDPRPDGNTSLAPVTIGSVQYLYPSDLQVGYDEESLFDEYGYPHTAKLAAILWPGAYDSEPTLKVCGVNLSSGMAVGPYDPADLQSFFTNATPAGEPDPSVVDVNLSSAPLPGCLASWDTTGVVAANTAELETMAEMAPGATVYAVTPPGESVTLLESALEAVLSPPNDLPSSVRAGLENVSVVAVAWATADQTVPAWVAFLEQAEGRGLTVVAATGDSGDNDHSMHWVETRATFPATAGSNTAGSLAVGGLTVTLDAATDHLENEVVWNVSTSYTAEGGPAGSAGGISAQYAEPGYQVNSSANHVLLGAGRGIPDVSAVANNTLVTLTVNGSQYLATNATYQDPFRFAYGTGVAAAYVAGLVGEIDYALRAANDTLLGFANPMLYALAQEAFSPAQSGGQITSTETGTYDSELPTSPFFDVVKGANDVYSAAVGYDLASGWGSIDAYNYTMYFLHAPTTGVYGDLSAVRDRLHLAGLAATSTNPDGVTDHVHNASLQQNFMLANSLGAPIYQVQSIVYLAWRSGSSWAMNFTANLTYPAPAFYPGLEIHEVWWPPGGAIETLPLLMTMTTTLVPPSGTTPAEVQFAYGLPASPTLTLEVPGAAFIIGRTGYSYNWQGTTYTDGPGPKNVSVAGFLDPQFVLVGPTPNWSAAFGPVTSGNLTATLEGSGASVFSPAKTGLVTPANTQTAASSRNLTYTSTGQDSYDYAYSAGANIQGIYQVQAPYYIVTFTQSGAPDGATWYVNLSNGVDLSGAGSTPSVSTPLENASYSWSASVDVRNWSSTPASGAFTVAGKAVTQALVFGPSVGTVTFKAKGPEKSGHLAFEWFANITGGPSYAGTALTFETNLTFGSYHYTLACANATFTAAKESGSFVAGPSAVVIDATFAVRTYPVEFIFHTPKPAPRLTIHLGSYSDTGVFSTWTLDEPKGSYSWSISGLPFGYGAIPPSGTVDVNGPVAPIVVTVSTSGWGPFGLGVVGYALIGSAVGVAAVWAVVFFWRRSRRRRRAELPPRPSQPDREAPPPTPEAPPPPSPKPRYPPRRGSRDGWSDQH